MLDEDECTTRYSELCRLMRRKFLKAEARWQRAECQLRDAAVERQGLEKLVAELRAAVKDEHACAKRAIRNVVNDTENALQNIAARERALLKAEADLAAREAACAYRQHRCRLLEVQLAGMKSAFDERNKEMAQTKQLLSQRAVVLAEEEVRCHARCVKQDGELELRANELKQRAEDAIAERARWSISVQLAQRTLELEKLEWAARQALYEDAFLSRTQMTNTLLNDVLHLGNVQGQAVQVSSQTVQLQRAKLADDEARWRAEVKDTIRRQAEDRARFTSAKEDVILQCYAALRHLRAAVGAVQSVTDLSPSVTSTIQRAENTLRDLSALHTR